MGRADMGFWALASLGVVFNKDIRGSVVDPSWIPYRTCRVDDPGVDLAGRPKPRSVLTFPDFQDKHHATRLTHGMLVSSRRPACCLQPRRPSADLDRDVAVAAPCGK